MLLAWLQRAPKSRCAEDQAVPYQEAKAVGAVYVPNLGHNEGHNSFSLQVLGYSRVDCIICGDSFSRGGQVTKNCQHARNSCPDCVKKMIDFAVEKGGWNDLRCPYTECKHKLGFEDIRLSASTTAFQR